MALSEDQKAILRLLAQRGAAGYDDLSALIGISVEEVHERAMRAAAELEAEGIPAPEIPDVAAPLPEAESAAPVEKHENEQRKTDEPKAERAAPPPPALPKGEPKPPLRKELKLLEGRGLWAILAGVAIVIVFVVILLVSGGSGGSSSSSTTVANNCETPTAAPPKPTGKAVAELAAAVLKGGKQPTRAVLNPVDGSEARGLAVFGRVKNKLALQVAIEGLRPSGACRYTIWLAASATKMLPLASTEVGRDGKIVAQLEVPVEILAYLANETFGLIAVTRTDESQLKASLAKATKEKKAPVYTGTEVLRGVVKGPIVGAAKK